MQLFIKKGAKKQQKTQRVSAHLYSPKLKGRLMFLRTLANFRGWQKQHHHFEMPGFGIFPLGSCFDGCRDHAQASGFGTRIWNLSDRPVELQIRVGSILKKVHSLKPGCSKRLKCKSIYKAYMPGRSMKSLLYYYDEACQPYVWIHESGGDSMRMVKQQFISLEDLREFSEIRIFRDHQRGCVSVRKKPRPDFC